MKFLRRHRSKFIPLLGLFFAMIFSNTTPLFSKELYDTGWTPVSVYFLTLLIMTIFLTMHEFIALERGERWGMDKRDYIGTILTTLTGGILSPVLFFIGLSYIDVSETVIITSMQPLFIVIFAVLFLKEHFKPSTLGGGALLIGGLLVLIWPNIHDAKLSIGVPLLLASSFCGSFTTIFHKKFVRHRHLDSIVLFRSAVSLLVVGLFMYFTERESFEMFLEPQNVWLVMGLPLIGFIAPFFLYFRALANVKAMDAGFVSAMGPVAGVLLAAVFRDEVLELRHVISLGLVMLGILFINVPLTKWRILPSRPVEAGPLQK